MRKVQATTSNKSVKSNFSSARRELTGTEANNSNDTPCVTTWADHQSERERGRRGGGREREGRPKRTVQTHSIHTKKQTETNATCRHPVPYIMGEYSALSCPGKVQSTQVSHNRETQHSTDSIARPLSASHWSGASRDTVFTNTPTTQVCRLLLLTTGLRWSRITGRLLHLHLLRGGTVEDASPLAVARTTSVHRLTYVALLGCSGSGRGGGGGGEGGSITGKLLQVRQLLDLMNFGVCVLNKNSATGSPHSRGPRVVRFTPKQNVVALGEVFHGHYFWLRLCLLVYIVSG